MFQLLREFYRCVICFHVSGSFPAYVAGIQTSYHLATVFSSVKGQPSHKFTFPKARGNRSNLYHQPVSIHHSASRRRQGCLSIQRQAGSIQRHDGFYRRRFLDSMREIFERQFCSFHLTVL